MLFLYLVSIIPAHVIATGNEHLDISIIICKEDMKFSYLQCDIAPFLKGGYTMVQLRPVAETFQFDVLWNEYEKSVTISKDSDCIKLWIGQSEITVNGTKTNLPIQPEISNGMTIIPLRYVCEFLNLNVLWKQYSQTQSFIWLSTLTMLNEQDVIPDENYCSVWEGVPYYTLKSDGTTYRGIKIGDSYKKVIDLYGIPHTVNTIGNNRKSLEYYTVYFPNSSSGSTLIFDFENENLISVSLDSAT